MRSILMLLVAVLCLACGGSGGGGSATKKYKPLGKAEKDRLKRVSSSMGEVLSLANSYLSTSKSSKEIGTRRPINLTNESMPPTDQPKLEKMKGELSKDNCQMKLPENIDYVGGDGGDMSPSIPLFEISISGEGCPIYMKMTMTGGKKGNSGERFDAVFTWVYEAYSDEFKAHTDVDKIQMSGKITGGSSAPGAVQQGGLMAMDTAMNITGVGHSQTEGDFTTASNLDMRMAFKMPNMGPGLNNLPDNGGGLDFGFDMTGHMNKTDNVSFGDVDAILESKTIIKGLMSFEEKHFVNNEPVTKEVYNEYAGDLVFPGQDDDFGSVTPGPGNGGGSTGPKVVQCWTTIYDSSKVSMEDVQKAIREHDEPKTPAIWGFNSCGPNDQVTMFKGQTVTAQFFHTIDSLAVKVLYGENTPIDFYVFEGEDLDLAKPFGDLIVRFACEKDLNCQP